MPIPDFITPGAFVEWTTRGTGCAVAQILSVTPTHIVYLSSDGVTASVFASQHFTLEGGHQRLAGRAAAQ